jgi:hypothetical protein
MTGFRRVRLDFDKNLLKSPEIALLSPGFTGMNIAPSYCPIMAFIGGG